MSFLQIPFFGSNYNIVMATQSFRMGILRISSNGGAYTDSSTASTWTTNTLSANTGWYDLEFSEESKLWVGVSENGPITRSSDLVTFTASQTVGAARSIKYINELDLWIAGGRTSQGSGNLAMFTSTDGINFTTQSTPSVSTMIEDITWNGSLAVAVGAGAVLITSPNGTSWTQRTAATGDWHGVGYSPQLGLFVAGGLNGQIATSSNGIDWNTTAVAGSWRRFAWSPTLNLFIGTRVGSTIAYSSDGGTWTASSSGSGNWWDAVWNEEYQRFFVTRISSQTRPVWTSTDGINWTQQITTLTSGTWVGLGFRKEIT
jgi:hypothetical protein